MFRHDARLVDLRANKSDLTRRLRTLICLWRDKLGMFRWRKFVEGRHCGARFMPICLICSGGVAVAYVCKREFGIFMIMLYQRCDMWFLFEITMLMEVPQTHKMSKIMSSNQGCRKYVILHKKRRKIKQWNPKICTASLQLNLASPTRRMMEMYQSDWWDKQNMTSSGSAARGVSKFAHVQNRPPRDLSETLATTDADNLYISTGQLVSLGMVYVFPVKLSHRNTHFQNFLSSKRKSSSL